MGVWKTGLECDWFVTTKKKAQAKRIAKRLKGRSAVVTVIESRSRVLVKLWN